MALHAFATRSPEASRGTDPGTTRRFRDSVRRFTHHKAATVAVFVLLAVTLSAVLAPWIAPYPLTQPDLFAVLQPPSWKHLMGTDPLGVDLFTEVLWGGRISLLIGLCSAVLGVSLGGLVGAVAGYFGGFIDTLLMRLTDVALSIPALFLVLVFTRLIGASPEAIILIIGITSWMYPARIMRSQVLSVRERDYVEAARAAGATSSRILWREIAPNAVAPLIVNATMLAGAAIVIEATLDFLGAGLSPPNVSWGLLLNEATSNLVDAPWLAIFPSIMIFLVVLSVNLIGDGLRDALDPTTRQS
jgi:peptide/nickel transport system permease protein